MLVNYNESFSNIFTHVRPAEAENIGRQKGAQPPVENGSRGSRLGSALNIDIGYSRVARIAG